MHSIWAVAKNTIKQALRMKIAVVFTILLLVLLPVMGLVTTGDGTLKGRLQTFISYSMSLTSLPLCLFTIIASTFSLTNDIKQKQIFTVITKPIRRSQLLIGKLLGVIILSSVLLAIFSAIIYTVAVYTPKFCNASEEELEQIKNEFFTARASLFPQLGEHLLDIGIGVGLFELGQCLPRRVHLSNHPANSEDFSEECDPVGIRSVQPFCRPIDFFLVYGLDHPELLQGSPHPLACSLGALVGYESGGRPACGVNWAGTQFRLYSVPAPLEACHP